MDIKFGSNISFYINFTLKIHAYKNYIFCNKNNYYITTILLLKDNHVCVWLGLPTRLCTRTHNKGIILTVLYILSNSYSEKLNYEKAIWLLNCLYNVITGNICEQRRMQGGTIEWIFPPRQKKSFPSPHHPTWILSIMT